MEPTIALLNQRRSVRSFSDRTITEETVRTIKQAVLRSPTAGNMVLYSVLEISDSSLKERLADLCDHQPMIAKAPLVWVFLADMTKWVNFYHESGTVAKGEILGITWRSPGAGDLFLALDDALIAAHTSVIAAQALGLGSCYIGDVLENHEEVASLLALPRYTMVAAMVIFGYPNEDFGTKSDHQLRPDAGHVFMENSYREPHLDQLRAAYRAQEAQMARQKRLPFDNSGSIADYYYFRKYTSSFMAEMNRSVAAMLERWLEPSEPDRS